MSDVCIRSSLLDRAVEYLHRRFVAGYNSARSTLIYVSVCLHISNARYVYPTSSFCFSSFSSRNLDTFSSLRAAASLTGASEKDEGFAIYRS